jgi:curved DNA-binding protein
MDPYKILGVDKSASAEDIKQAYRRMAAKHHPDRGGDTARFQEIQSAYDTLSNPQSRARFDNPAHNAFHADFNTSNFDFDSIFNIFGTRFNFRHQPQARINMTITLKDVIECPTRTVNIATEHGTNFVEIQIPPGVDDGTQVNYNGIAPGGIDLLVLYRVQPHPKWKREGFNLHTEHEVSIWQLITGCSVELNLVTGETVSVSIPARTQPNAQLRLSGLGLPDRSKRRGDGILHIRARIPNQIPDDLEQLIRRETGLT